MNGVKFYITPDGDFHYESFGDTETNEMAKTLALGMYTALQRSKEGDLNLTEAVLVHLSDTIFFMTE